MMLLDASVIATVAVQAESQVADEPAPAAEAAQSKATDAPKAAAKVFPTGVAKGRDRLDGAMSTSSLRQAEILKFAPQSIGDLLRNVPGVRSEANAGEGNANITIRGLPMASTGAKFVQLEEDGLPICNFGDITFSTADSFLRADFNLAHVQVIRGVSASTTR